MFQRLLAAALCLGADPGLAGSYCGGDVACTVDGGNYRIELPQDGDVRGAYVYFHGFKSSAELQMRQRALVDTTLAHHLAYVAVDGLAGGWSYPGAPRRDRDERRFIGNVLNDLQNRHGFAPEKVIVGGFSVGASMAWYTACEQGGRVAAMVTFSGVFWDPLPKAADCTGNLPPMIHFHGTADRTFPLAGRPIGRTFHQGDALKSVAIYRERARCDLPAAHKSTIDGIVCDDVPGCLRGESILCIHDGGHEARPDLLDAGLTALGYPK
ncbi:dienelactone hydrolase family protein [Neorhizobium sp. Rsf11]|uniref:Dienelactone hydrolase family protein n=1 Tax=Neorhizobium phenanthreniclasticum TaxID=3157917 RepID=A0ABV0M910_9HYPH